MMSSEKPVEVQGPCPCSCTRARLRAMGNSQKTEIPTILISHQADFQRRTLFRLREQWISTP